MELTEKSGGNNPQDEVSVSSMDQPQEPVRSTNEINMSTTPMTEMESSVKIGLSKQSVKQLPIQKKKIYKRKNPPKRKRLFNVPEYLNQYASITARLAAKNKAEIMKTKIIREAVVKALEEEAKKHYIKRAGDLFYRTMPEFKKKDIPQMIEKLWAELPQGQRHAYFKKATKDISADWRFELSERRTTETDNEKDLLTLTVTATTEHGCSSCVSMSSFVEKTFPLITIPDPDPICINKNKKEQSELEKEIVVPPPIISKDEDEPLFLYNFDIPFNGKIQLCLTEQASFLAVSSPWYSEEFYTQADRDLYDICEEPSHIGSIYSESEIGLLDYCLFNKLSGQWDSKSVTKKHGVTKKPFGKYQKYQDLFID